MLKRFPKFNVTSNRLISLHDTFLYCSIQIISSLISHHTSCTVDQVEQMFGADKQVSAMYLLN